MFPDNPEPELNITETDKGYVYNHAIIKQFWLFIQKSINNVLKMTLGSRQALSTANYSYTNALMVTSLSSPTEIR
jgi:hypothetical protein